MSNLFTVQSLITKVRERTGLVGSQFCTDPEIQGYLAEAAIDYYDALDGSGLLYSEAPATVTTAGGASEYPLTNVKSIITVWLQLDANTVIPLQEVDPRERHRLLIQGASWATHYQHVGSNIRLLPTPPNGQTYVVTYVADHANLESIAPTQTIDLVVAPGLSYLVSRGSAAVFNKMENFDQEASQMGKAAEAMKRVEESAQNRSWSTNRRVVDMRRSLNAFIDPSSVRWGRKP